MPIYIICLLVYILSVFGPFISYGLGFEISTIFKSNQHIQSTWHFHTSLILPKLTCLSLDIASEEMNSFLLNLDTKQRVKGLFRVNPNSSSHRTYARKIWTSYQKLKGKVYILCFRNRICEIKLQEVRELRHCGICSYSPLQMSYHNFKGGG